MLIFFFLTVSAFSILGGYTLYKTAQMRRDSRDRLLALLADDEEEIDDDLFVVDPAHSPFASRDARTKASPEDGNPYRAPRG